MTTLMSHFRPLDGYGYAAIHVGEAWGQLDPGLRLVDMCVEPSNMDDWLLEDRVVALNVPTWFPRIACQRLIGFSMFESTRLPDEHVRALYYCHTLIVPSAFCAETFEQSGVHLPIHIAPLGIDPYEDGLIERERTGDRPYTFLWSGTGDWRKGWDVAYQAFSKCFAGDQRARLILHFRQALPREWRFADENVSVIVGAIPASQMRQLYRDTDCFAFPSRGEGWGLPPRQAAATGLPVIATDWGGLHEDIEHWALPLPIKGLTKARFGSWSDVGEWAEPDVDALAERMRWCFDHPTDAAQFGQQASAWLHREQTWEKTARAVMQIVESEAVREFA